MLNKLCYNVMQNVVYTNVYKSLTNEKCHLATPMDKLLDLIFKTIFKNYANNRKDLKVKVERSFFEEARQNSYVTRVEELTKNLLIKLDETEAMINHLQDDLRAKIEEDRRFLNFEERKSNIVEKEKESL